MARHQVCQIVAALGLVSWVNGFDGGFPSGSKRDRIVGGIELAPHSLPWQAELYYINCGATILSAKFVLTTARCCTKRCKRNKVVVGAHDISKDEPTQTRYAVKEGHIHPKFDSVKQWPPEYNFALLELWEPIHFWDVAKAISLPSPQDTEEEGAFNKDTVFVICGWGQKGSEMPGSDVLLSASVPWVSDEACQKAYDDNPINGKIGNETITEDMICAGTAVKGPCTGDQGGPLAWLDPETKVVKLIGVTSWGRLCKTPSVFAELTTVLDWIREIIGDSNEEACSKGNCMTWDDLNEDARQAFLGEAKTRPTAAAKQVEIDVGVKVNVGEKTS